VLVRVDGVGVWRGAEGPFAFGRLAFHAVDDPVDDHLAFELGEHAEHLDQHPACGGGGVERLGGRAEDHAGVVEVVEQGDQVADAAGEPVDAVDQQDVEAAGAGGGEGILQAVAVEAAGGGVVD